MTERLYYSDPCLLKFEGEIVRSEPDEAHRFLTVLDRSAFYPTSGGQSHDTGVLNGVEIIDVIENESGEIVHVSEQRVGEIGDRVAGMVNRERRDRNRQLHTAQHILSHAFIQLYGYETVSVHLGDEYGAVELNSREVTEEQLNRAAQLSNGIVAENTPVEIVFADSHELEQWDLRKTPERSGTIRIIKTGEYDISACGGTHCNSTAEVGLIHLIGTEPIRGHTLVTFLAGQQAFDDYRLRYAVTSDLSRDLTCHVSDLPGRVSKLTEENKAVRKELAALQRELLPVWVEQLAAKAERVDDLSVVVENPGSMEMGLATQLAGSIAGKISGVALLFVSGKLVLAVGGETGLHAGKLMRALAEQSGLKGGGGPAVAQAGGADSENLQEYKTALVSLAGKR